MKLSKSLETTPAGPSGCFRAHCFRVRRWPVADLEANFSRQGSGREREPNLIPSLLGGDSWNPSFRPLSL